MTDEDARPFAGIRVLDLTHVLAGPFCTQQLAMLGADVIKIESPGRPDMTRQEGVDPDSNAELYGTDFIAQNNGKRAITLDLARPAGAEVMRRLVATADVVVQNYAAGALDALGFGADALEAINPQLITCSLTGFGRTGPKADHPAFDIVVQAYSGAMSTNGKPESGPVRVGPPMVDYGTGAQAAFAISAALFQRTRTGIGQRIDVAMVDAAFMLMGSLVAGTELTGESPALAGNVHPLHAGYRTFDTSDGVLMIGAYTNEQLARLFDALGETDRAAAVRGTDRLAIRESIDADNALLQSILLTRSADTWEELLNNARVPAARVRTIDEALASEQVQSRSIMQDGLPIAGFEFAHGSPRAERPPPRFGEHTHEILAELGYSSDAIDELASGRAI